MSIKKINIKQLKVGMFIVGMDISWIRSPFLKHSRLIEKNNDIQLLIQAGVKEVTIDTDKSIEKPLAEVNSKNKQISGQEGKNNAEVKNQQQNSTPTNIDNHSDLNSMPDKKASETSLKDELNHEIMQQFQIIVIAHQNSPMTWLVIIIMTWY